jgi:hypothetical protein
MPRSTSLDAFLEGIGMNPGAMSDRDAMLSVILRALDLGIQRAARSRGMQACDGLNRLTVRGIRSSTRERGEFAADLAPCIDEADGVESRDRIQQSLALLDRRAGRGVRGTMPKVS